MRSLTHFQLKADVSDTLEASIATDNPFLRLFTAFPHVTHFSLKGNCVDNCDVDAAVARLVENCPLLEDLFLSRCKMTDESLEQLATLHHLKRLVLLSTYGQFTFDGVRLLLQGASRHTLTSIQLRRPYGNNQVFLQEIRNVSQETGRRSMIAFSSHSGHHSMSVIFH